MEITVNIPKDLELEKGWVNGFTLKRKFKKVRPNQPCTCGSGKKAKKCCYSPYN